MDEVFKYIVANKFFPQYAPRVKSWKHKLRGKNGRGNPIEWSEQDKADIKAGLKKLFTHLSP